MAVVLYLYAVVKSTNLWCVDGSREDVYAYMYRNICISYVHFLLRWIFIVRYLGARFFMSIKTNAFFESLDFRVKERICVRT